MRSTLTALSAELTAEESGLSAIELEADRLRIQLKNAAADAATGDDRVCYMLVGCCIKLFIDHIDCMVYNTTCSWHHRLLMIVSGESYCGRGRQVHLCFAAGKLHCGALSYGVSESGSHYADDPCIFRCLCMIYRRLSAVCSSTTVDVRMTS